MEGTELAKGVEDMPEDEPQGTPQGGVMSQLLANIYLDPLDWLMAGPGFEMVRYADDMVVLCRSQEEAGAGLEKLREWMAGGGNRSAAEIDCPEGSPTRGERGESNPPVRFGGGSGAKAPFLPLSGRRHAAGYVRPTCCRAGLPVRAAPVRGSGS
ncbi:MAG: hypothetical protein K9N23_21205 [Akkermansiaceae bacterium]|nr:hypothetical protein [Akkermansiaceae bacterium]